MRGAIVKRIRRNVRKAFPDTPEVSWRRDSTGIVVLGPCRRKLVKQAKAAYRHLKGGRA